jgi:hypothetical protein
VDFLAFFFLHGQGGRTETECGGQVMHQGVLRDDARRAAKQKERSEGLEASREKQRTYEGVQKVGKD